jgi:hypothetical protein
LESKVAASQPSNEVGVAPPPSMSQLSRHSLRPIASGQQPSAFAKHDQPARILLDAGSEDRSGSLKVSVPIDDLLDAGALAAQLEKLDRVFCNVGRHWPDSGGPPTKEFPAVDRAASDLNAGCLAGMPPMPSARFQAIQARLYITWLAVQKIQVAVAEFQNQLNDQQHARLKRPSACRNAVARCRAHLAGASRPCESITRLRPRHCPGGNLRATWRPTETRQPFDIGKRAVPLETTDIAVKSHPGDRLSHLFGRIGDSYLARV